MSCMKAFQVEVDVEELTGLTAALHDFLKQQMCLCDSKKDP